LGPESSGFHRRVYALAGKLQPAGVSRLRGARHPHYSVLRGSGQPFKSTGGPYLYARTAFGPLIGFEVGWLMWLARVSAFAALCNLFVSYFSYLVPMASAPPWRPL